MIQRSHPKPIKLQSLESIFFIKTTSGSNLSPRSVTPRSYVCICHDLHQNSCSWTSYPMNCGPVPSRFGGRQQTWQLKTGSTEYTWKNRKGLTTLRHSCYSCKVTALQVLSASFGCVKIHMAALNLVILGLIWPWAVWFSKTPSILASWTSVSQHTLA